MPTRATRSSSRAAVNNPGNDPQGYPDAEHVIDIVAHEVNEAMTDPEGVGYMDPNGFEIGDKCEFGPQFGTPLGFAPDGSPFNQVVNGHKYLIQEMWANRDNSNTPNCVQATTNTTNPLPLPQVHLTQFSPTVSGNIEHHTAGVSVKVTLQRASASGTPVTVASGSATTASDGSWSVSLGTHAVGDDRDAITVDYSGAGAPRPSREQILTGNGGNPFTESGWTGWVAMDNGSLLTNTQTLQGFPPPTITLQPCFQTGVEAFTVGGVPGTESPTDFCNTSSDAATAPLKAAVTPGQAVTWSSLDDRAFTPPGDPNPNLTGALVNLTVPAGEADSVSSFSNPFAGYSSGRVPDVHRQSRGRDRHLHRARAGRDLHAERRRQERFRQGRRNGHGVRAARDQGRRDGRALQRLAHADDVARRPSAGRDQGEPDGALEWAVPARRVLRPADHDPADQRLGRLDRRRHRPHRRDLPAERQRRGAACEHDRAD